ncbi:bifunctional diaminohydroxyphosphoribosylaminopyrimidine deaminase/5-amino-6-(5-phosphoribosylamino)uracil reductase RibD [Brevibacterium daeguense]|uniref:Riboflavin biosynthesis protein RibD n=1 Tax=Brevibacterium daeguense TaxID=909936 RepID=A0ABP8EKH7_9MICO
MDADRTVFSYSDTEAMRVALDAAGHGVRGANPLVGAAVRGADGTLAVGWHRGAGTPHAEVDALLRARSEGIDLTDSTLYVSLEPCNHTGRTGPCADLIADAGIPRVVYAYPDLHHTAAGGAERLRDLGVEVVGGLLADDAHALNARWFAAKAAHRPFVTLKLAQSLDGRIAAADGTSRWISSQESRDHVHALRARVDAILVGTGTAIADNPRLTARDEGGRERAEQPVPVVLGEREIPADSHLGRNPATLRLHTHDPAEAVRQLGAAGIEHLLVEGGAHVAGAFLAADLVDEIELYIAPLLLGEGLPAVRGLEVATLSDAYRFTPDFAGPEAPARLGPDVFLRLVPAPDPNRSDADPDCSASDQHPSERDTAD